MKKTCLHYSFLKMKTTQNQLKRFKTKKLLLTLTIIFTLCINAQTPITDANFQDAVNTCLSTNPVYGLCSNSEYGAMPDWDVSQVTNMSGAFDSKSAFNGDIGAWDVSNVTNMERMFYQAPSFNQDIAAWDVSKVTNMERMFVEASSFNGDIGAWDVSNVTNMRNMFTSASSFNQDIGAWDVSNVMNMSYMFTSASSFNQDISGWCVSNISSEPNSFSIGSPLTEANKPVWGTCPALGIDDQYFTNLSIYPNPAENSLFISGNTALISISISIYNVLGKEVLSMMNTDHINVAKLPSGLYVLKISSGTHQINRKFIKN